MITQDILRGASRVPALGTRDEPLRTSAWEARVSEAEVISKDTI